MDRPRRGGRPVNERRTFSGGFAGGSLDRLLTRVVDRVKGRFMAPYVEAITAMTLATEAAHDEERRHLLQMEAAIAALDDRLGRVQAIASAALDDISGLRAQLIAARSSPEYEDARREQEPLVTVRIPTYVRTDLLLDRALPSVLGQTYSRLEVIVVGDGCTDEVGRRVEALGDARVRFVNLPHRFPYPDDRDRRWQVAGSPGMNAAALLANGMWIATLYDDDEFAPDHVECLIDSARRDEWEMVYGDIHQVSPDPAGDVILSSYPPAHGAFGFQAAIYLRALRFFEFNTKSWVLDEPGDWNLCRRMLETGVRIGHVPRVVTTYYPSKLYDEEWKT